jgi:HK97 family phage prohead protease
MERKSIRTRLEVKEDSDGEDGMFISGYFSTFGGEPDAVGDIVDKGAFKRTIDQRGPKGSADIVGMWRHRDPMGPLVEMKEDKKGGWFRMRLSDTPENKDNRWPYLLDGVVREVSFMFDTIKSYKEEIDGEEIRHLQEVKLYEISPVPFGANPNTSIDGFKSRLELELGLPGLFSEDEEKVGRVLSGRNKKTIITAIASMGEATKQLEALLKAAESDDGKSTPRDQASLTEVADPSIIAHLAEMKASFENLSSNLKKIRG